MFVLTVDQKNSRREDDRVPAILEALSDIPTVAGFERTVGDEVQGVLDDSSALVDALRWIIRDGGWHVGLGIGEISPEDVKSIRLQGVRVGRGVPFVYAREAVEAAKGHSASVAVKADDDAAQLVQSILRLLVVAVEGRTKGQRAVVELFDRGLTGKLIAERLRISPSSVSARKSLSHIDEEREGWISVVHILSDLHERLEVGRKGG